MQHGFVIGMICFLFYCPVWAQEVIPTIKNDTANINTKHIQENQLKEFRDNPDFDYEIIKSTAPDWWVSFKNWITSTILRFLEWLFGVEKAAGVFSVFLEIIPYILLAVLLFILIKFFVNVNARAVMHAKKNQTIVALSEEEHIIKNEDIQQLIQNALGQQDYRLAVRYYYLYMLQLMTEKELITWEPQKTNEDYTKELQQQELAQPFATCTRLYNYFWYGEFPIDETKYQKAEANFLSLKKLLTNG